MSTFREVAMAYLQGIETGRGPTLEELVRNHPEHAARLVDFVMHVRAMEPVEEPVAELQPVSEQTRQWIKQRLAELLAEESLSTAATLGAYVRQRREARSMSRRELAQATGYVERVIEDLESDALLPTRLSDRAWLRLKERLGMPAVRLWELIVQAMQPGAVRSPGMALPRMSQPAEPEEREAFLSAPIPGLDQEEAELLESIRAALTGDAPRSPSSA
jgi:transcriptional regulator with XRE-family HTH domain